jgi:hypothetical protein
MWRGAVNKVILDPELKSKLNGLDRQLEICDETGRTLGHFLPADVYRQLLLAWAEAQVTDEELERRRQEPRGRTLPEIWKSLGQS